MIGAKRIESILVATELKRESADLVRAAADLAIVTGAKLHVVHAHQEPSILSGEGDLLAVQRQVHRKRAKLLGGVIGSTTSRVDLASARVQIGNPAEVILREAEAVGADIIVMGAHRDRGLGDRVIGATVEHVARRAEIPCLILNGPLSLPLERIVVPTDLSDHSRKVAGTALGWADWLSRTGEAVVTLAHVSEDERAANGSGEALRRELRIRIADAKRRADCDGTVESTILIGTNAVDEILDYSEKVEAGMIVAGARGLPAALNALLGSFSSALIRRADVPVLLVPQPVRHVARRPRTAVADDSPASVAV